MSINWSIDKQNMVYPYNRLLSSNKKEQNTDRCCNMDKSQKYERSQIQRLNLVWFHLYKIFKKGKSIEQSTNQWLPGAGDENEGQLWTGQRGIFRGDRNVLKLAYGDNASMYLLKIIELCTQNGLAFGIK